MGGCASGAPQAPAAGRLLFPRAMPNTAGRYIAEERGAFEVPKSEDSIEEPGPEVELKPAMAPMFETAMLHMGPDEFARFMHWYGGLA